MTYYIDPGTTKGCAVACFGSAFPPGGRTLTGLGVWSDRNGIEAHWGIFAGSGAVWELPQLYPNARREKPQVLIAKANDLIALAAAGAACANVLGWGRGGVRSVLPRQWKGQLPKPVTHWHALRVLSEGEQALLVEAYGKPQAALVAYINTALEWTAKNPGKPLKGYSAKITDLLDAVTLGLVEEGRLRL